MQGVRCGQKILELPERDGKGKSVHADNLSIE
jgi:hypothetical protein